MVPSGERSPLRTSTRTRVGRGAGLSAPAGFLSPVFWGRVLGPIVIFISAPLTTMIKIALDSRPGTH